MDSADASSAVVKAPESAETPALDESAAAPTPPARPDRQVSSGQCPKCGALAPARAVTSCTRCGLLRSRWPTFRAQIAPHPVLDPLWEATLKAWDDPQRHQALHKVASTDWTLLSGVSQRYSQVLRERPDDDTAKRAMALLIEAALLLPLPRQQRVREGLGQFAQVAKALLGIGMLVLSVLLTLAVLRR